MKDRKFVLFATVVAALGGFLFGFDTAVIAGAEKSIQQLFQLSGFWHGFTVAIALIGTVIGSIVAGKPADILGRRKVLIVVGLLYSVSALGSGLATNWISLLIYRFIGGVGVGASSVVGPMYISEIAPSRLRGRLVALFQLNIVLGVLASYFSNYLLSGIGENAWRWMLGVEFVPAILFFFLVFLIPSSPRWLVKQKRVDEARQILTKIGEENVEQEVQEIVDSVKTEIGQSSVKLLTRKYSRPIAFAMLLAVFNQLTGINALMYYAPRIFEMAGLAKDTAMLQSVIIAVINLIFTLVAMSVIDKFGRKTLLIIGSFGLIFSLAMVSHTFFTHNFGGYIILIYLIIFIIFFAFSQGAVIWVFLAEIFPNKVRGKGQALGSFTHWVGAALISWMFPMVAENPNIGGGYAFLFFSIMMVFQLIFVGKFLPETKNKSLEQIERELGLN